MADNNNLYTASSSSSSSSPGHYSPGTATMSRSESGINKQPMIHDSLYCVDNPGGQITVNVDSYDRLTELTSPNSLGGKSNGEPISKESAEKHKDNADKLLDSLSGRGLQSVKSHAQLAKTAHGVRILAKNLNKATIHLQLGSIMIITKARDNSLVYLTRELAEWLLTKSPTVSVYVDYHLERSKRFDVEGLINDVPSASNRIKFWNKALIRESPDIFDLVVTLGGDGTVLYASTLFQRVVPPIMSFALGSLGFLTNFKFEDFRTIFTNMIIKGVHTNLRMRFTCRVHKANDDLVCEQQVLNELTIDRGPSPWVSMLELYGDGSLLTVAQADGLIIATPTGSTAYSLSAGGSLVHPSVSAISVTPICPHTLSFRPILLPDSMTLKVKVPQRSRATAWASFDGRSRIELLKGYYVTITASPFPFPTVRSSKNEYFDSVSRVLNWNSRDEQRSFVHLLSDKNRKSYATYQRRHGSTPESDYEEDEDTLEFLSGRDSAKFDKVKGVKPTFQINDQNIGNLVPHNLHAKTSSKLKNVLEFSDSDSPSGKESSKELSDSDTGIDDTKDADERFEIDYNDEQMPDCGDSGNKDAVSLSDSTVDIDDKEEDYHNNYFFPTSSESLKTPLVISDTSSIVGGLGPYVAENSSKLQNVESDHSRSFGKELAKQLHNLSMRDKEK